MTEHSPLPWQVQPYTGPPDEGIGIISLRGGGSYDQPTNGLVAIATLMPTEIDANDTSRAQANAELIVKSVNALPVLVKALEEVRKIISEGAMEGFNPKVGDWAERLFASQGMTNEVLKSIKK